MLPKPKHLGREYAEQFQDQSVVDVYHCRPPYPVEVFEVLAGLIVPNVRTVLDIGCGTGELARPLARIADRVDAVDFSPAMIRKGKSLIGGDHPHLAWICAPAEEAPLSPPYGLMTAGASLHWMDWDLLMPRLEQVLAPGGYLAIVGLLEDRVPWADELGRLLARYSTNRDYQPYNVVEELETRGLFQRRGARETAPVEVVQSPDEYVVSFHARNGFSRDRMPIEHAHAFDASVRELVRGARPDGTVRLLTRGKIDWGIPGDGTLGIPGNSGH